MSRTYRLRHWRLGSEKVKHYVDSRLYVRENQAEMEIYGFRKRDWWLQSFWLNPDLWRNPVLPVAHTSRSRLSPYGIVGVPSSIKKPRRKAIYRWLRRKGRILIQKAGEDDWDSLLFDDYARALAEDAFDMT